MFLPPRESASRARNILGLTDKDMDARALRQAFHVAFPAGRQYTPNRLRWGRFFILAFRSDSGGPPRGVTGLFRVRDTQP
jgi:hypothetical protein